MGASNLPSETNAYVELSDVDAEQAVLNLLLDPLGRNEHWQAACDVIQRNLAAEDFAAGRPNGTIFQAIVDVTTQGGPPDFGAVVAKVPNEHRAYLASLVDPGLFLPSYGGPMACHAAFYASRVRDLAVKRRGLAALGVAASGFMDPELSASEAIQQARERLEVATAGEAADSGIYELPDLYGAISDLYENGGVRGMDTGWPELDEWYRPVPGDWTLVTGIPSHGKSAWLDALMVNLARNQGGNFAVCSPETQPLARHAAKLAKLWTGKPFDRGAHERMSEGELMDALSWEHEHFTFVLPHGKSRSLPGVLALMETVLRRRDLTGIVIDPWNQLDHSRPAGMSMTDWVSHCLTVLANFTRRYQVHAWLVAHPTITRLQKDRNTGKYPVPTPYDVSDSSHWFNKADNCLTIYRDDDSGLVQLHLQKNRLTGLPAVVEFRYDWLTGRYASLSMRAA